MRKLLAAAAALVLILTLGAASALAGRTITPLYPTVDIDHLEDRFVTTDIRLKEGSGDIAVFTLYERERFAASAIRNAAAGDVIVTDGREVAVTSVDVDGPDFIFNKGADTEMLFCDTAEGTFEHAGENEVVPDICLGSFEVELLDYFPVLDWVDPRTGRELENLAVRTGEELRALLADPSAVGFGGRNVRVLYDNMNQPRLIWRFAESAESEEE